METLYRKDARYGWQAKTFISMGPAKDAISGDGERRLLIETQKNSLRPELYSRAAVSLHSEGCYTHAFGLGTGRGDYSRQLLRSGDRCTEKNIRALHADALKQADAILAEAHAHYTLRDTEREARIVG